MYINIHQLKPHPDNVKIYGVENVDELAAQIEQSGWIKPLVVTDFYGGYTIVSGHRRHAAALKLAWDIIPCEVEHFEAEWQVMERLLLENDNREKTTLQRTREFSARKVVEAERAKWYKLSKLKHNIVPEIFPEREEGDARDIAAEQSGFGSGKTAEAAEDIVQAIDELEAQGEEEKADLLKQSLEQKNVSGTKAILDFIEGLSKEDAAKYADDLKVGRKTVTQVKKEIEVARKEKEKERQRQELMQKAESIIMSETIEAIKIERGKWYEVGPHRIYCGSNMDEAFISQLPKTFDFAFADPPYNEDLAEWDSGFTWEADYLSDVAKIVAVTPGIRAIPQFIAATKMPYRWSMAAHITNGMTRGALGFCNWVYIALFSNMASIHRNAQDVLKVNISTSENSGHYHKGKKPSHLMLQMVEMFSSPGAMVLDPFLGSGSTLFACEKLGRICYGAEISPEYVSLILANYGKNSI